MSSPPPHTPQPRFNPQPAPHTLPPPVPAARPVVATGPAHISRIRTYEFILDEAGLPVELGSGRFAKAFLGQESWLESSTEFRRKIAIKILQKGVSTEDRMRFDLEKEILEGVQGHPNIIEIFASGEAESSAFIPASLRGKVENDFMILELLDTSLEERLKGSRTQESRDDLLARPAQDRIFGVLDYMLPVASAVEFAHLDRDTSHRDIKPGNVMLKLPDPHLSGSRMIVKLVDFNVGKSADEDVDLTLTRLQSVPGTLYFQSPEQETNHFEVLVNVDKGAQEVEFFEDFYIDIFENDTFSVYNRPEVYRIAGADRARKRILLSRPFGESSEISVRAKVTKAVGRPADIYSLGALFYYLVSGAYANPKTLYDAFRKFIEFERKDETNSVEAYIDHEYTIIQKLNAPKTDSEALELAPEDRFFSYKHYLDGNGELIDPVIMKIVAKAMIRGKPDSYCNSWELDTTGISEMVDDLIRLALSFGVDPSVRSYYPRSDRVSTRSGPMRRAWDRLSGKQRRRR